MRKNHGVGVLAVVVLAVSVTVALVLRRSDPSIQLVDAAERGDLATVTQLVQQGASINRTSPIKFGWTPLIGAIFHNQTNVVQYLVASGADVNLPDKNGVTPLMWMTGWGDEAVPWVRFLITHGASLDAKDKYGATALDYAKGDPPKPELIRVLVTAKTEQEKPQK